MPVDAFKMLENEEVVKEFETAKEGGLQRILLESYFKRAPFLVPYSMALLHNWLKENSLPSVAK